MTDSLQSINRHQDMSHGRETYARSFLVARRIRANLLWLILSPFPTFDAGDYPAGYGGHIPSIRFDVLHRNTAFDRRLQ